MRSKRNKGKHENLAPIIFVDGMWYCPQSKAPMFPTSETVLMVSDESYADLNISDRLFFEKWLPNIDNQNGATEMFSAELRKALELCKKAAHLNNPYALISLGYYYENGYDASMSLGMSLKAAKLCYQAVSENAQNAKYLEFGAPADLEPLKVKAMAYLEALKIKVGGSEELDMEHVFELITNRDTSLERVPIFGVFQLNKEQADKLIGMEKKSRLGKDLGWDFLPDRPDIYIAQVKGNDQEVVFTLMKNKNSMGKSCKEEGLKYYFGFVIHKHVFVRKFLSKKQEKRLFNLGRGKEGVWKALFCNLIEHNLCNNIFCENDLYLCSTEKSGEKSWLETTVSAIIEKLEN